MDAIFDSTIVIDYLNGIQAAVDEMERYEDISVSTVTWIEVIAGARTPEAHTKARELLATFNIVPLDLEIAERAAMLRQTARLKTPDAIIRATADHLGQLLVTRNSKDFKPDDPGIRIPYVI